MTELEAVNYLLDVLGSPPLGDLETLHPDADSSLKKLRDSAATLQKEGMWYNKELSVEFTPDETTKEIILPNTCLKVLGICGDFVIQRGTKLYDTINNTYQFDAAIHIDYIDNLQWDLLPYSVQEAAKFHGAMQVCSIDLEDARKYEEQRALYEVAYIQLKKDDLEIKRRNVLNTPTSRRMRAAVRPYRLYGGGSYNPYRPGG